MILTGPAQANLKVFEIPLQVPQITLVSPSGRSLSLELVLVLQLGLVVLVLLEGQQAQQEQQERGREVLFEPSALRGCCPRPSAGSHLA